MPYNVQSDLVAVIMSLETKIDRLERASGLASSSIEDGAVTANSGSTLMMQLGLQFDGTYAAASFNGPEPPPPTTPTVTAHHAGLLVTWDGTFLDSVPVPMDFKHVEIHTSTTTDFDATGTSTLRCVIPTSRGGQYFVGRPAGTHHVKLVTWSQSGISSVPSAQASATVAAF